MEYKNVSAEIKADVDERTFEGYASTFDNIDLGGDRVVKGAYKKTIKERFKGGKIKLLWQHFDPLGMPIELEEDSKGLRFKARVSNTTLGNDALELIRDGAVDRMSIGYEPVNWKMNEKDQVRDLTEIKLHEISPVTFAMNEDAVITGVKSILNSNSDAKRIIEMLEKVLENKTTVSDQNLPLADRDREWDADGAGSRVRRWAEAEDAPNAKYRRAFLWYDSENEDNFGAYKLPYADVIDGTLTAVPRAIFAAAAAIQGARGGVDIPDSDVNKIKSHLDKYYARMREDFEDDDIVAPWNEEAGNTVEVFKNFDVDIFDSLSDYMKRVTGTQK